MYGFLGSASSQPVTHTAVKAGRLGSQLTAREPAEALGREGLGLTQIDLS